MHDVFISYASEDEAQAIAIKGILETYGINCWFAPSSIRATQDFTKRIPKAIKSSKAFLILMSSSAQKSKWVKRELGTADKYNIPFYTFFLEKCELEEDFDFILQFNQHYKADLAYDERISRLLAELREDFANPSMAVHPSQVPSRPKRTFPVAFLGIAAALAALAAAVVLLFGGGFSGFKDGEYVIWNPEHEVAMSCDVIHDYYLAGEPVLVQRDAMTAPSSKCVWELDFDGDTFTISRAGQLLGVKPKKNGVGLGGDHIYVEWELDDQGDGLYFIRNKDTQQYLEWYEDKNNWCIHGDTSGDKRVLFLLRIEPVK